jgi:7,8-dihydropterin-6-yl-methyl-4-(beta-D-ribofuranosyl)aminobenzene 5'-phosphate synthase
MKSLKIIIAVFILLFIAITAIALLQPDVYSVERSVRIDSDKEKVFEYMQSPENWLEWAVWLDTNEYSVSRTGKPRINANNENRDVSTIIFDDLSGDTLLQVEIRRLQGFNSITRISLRKMGAETEVNWNEFGETGWHPARKLFLNFFMDDFIGPEIRKSLMNMKFHIENQIDSAMDITILYDNSKAMPELEKGWGFSALVENVLFDTGDDFDKLIYNIKELKIDPQKINYIVLSHKHNDHTGGAFQMAGLLDSLKAIYICGDFSYEMKARLRQSGAELIVADTAVEIVPGIYTSGQFIGSHRDYELNEHCLVLHDGNQIGIVTGCAHPGIDEMVETCRRRFNAEKIAFVAGGFHTNYLSADQLKALAIELKKTGVEKVMPMHCSGKAALPAFKEVFGDSAVKMAAGSEFEF